MGTSEEVNKKLGEDLRASEERFKRLTEAAFEGIVIHNQGKIIEVNQQYLDMFGYTLKELLEVPHSQTIAPECMDLVREKMASGYEGVYEILAVKKDGTVFPIEVQARNSILNGQPIRIAAFRDMTEKKQKEEQLNASQMQLKRLSEATFEGIVTHDNGVFVEANQQFADMFGYSLEELKELNGLDLFTPESREIAREKIASGDPGPYEATCLRKDGSILPVEIRARSVDLKGKHLRIAVCRDLTEQKKLQHDLIESEQKHRELYKNARACLFRNRISDGKIIACSRAGAALFGYADVEEFMARCSATDFYVDPQRRDQLLEALRKDKQVEDFQVQVKHRDGTPFWVSVTAEIFPEQDYLEGVMIDITAMKTLTKTEKTVLDHLMQGKSNKEIAFETGRSRRTVEDHRASIMKKLGVDNIVDLTQKALSLKNHHTEK